LGKAADAASTIGEQAQRIAGSQFSTQKDRAASTLDTLAQTLRDASSSLSEQQPQLAGIGDQAAERVEGISTYVREHDMSEMIGEAESFARRQPAVFLGAAFAAGFVAARFLKATRPESTSGRGSASSYGATGTGYRSSYGASAAGYGMTDSGHASSGTGYGMTDTGSMTGSGYGMTDSGYGMSDATAGGVDGAPELA